MRWTDEGLGRIVVRDADGGRERVVTSQPGHYASPRFSPNGNTIVFEKRGGGYLTSPEWSDNTGVYQVAVSGGTPELVSRDMGDPQFADDSDRLFMVGREGEDLALVSTDLNGEAKRVHAKGDLVNAFAVSPDGRFLAFRQNYEVFAMPLMPGGQAVTVSPDGGPLPVVKASSGGADYIGWSRNGDTLNWSIGPTLYSASIPAMFAFSPRHGNRLRTSRKRQFRWRWSSKPIRRAERSR